MRIAILGRTHWLINATQALQAAGHQIVLVASTAPAPEYQAGIREFEAIAREAGAPFFNSPEGNSPEFIAALSASGAEIGISVNWPKLIRAGTCEALRHGILNAHAGDLPRYRGNACPNWAILNGESHVGLCVHAMDPNEIDAGPVFARDRFALDDIADISDVYAWLDKAIPALFVRAVERAAEPGFLPDDQKASGVRPLRCYPRRPEDARIDWTRDAVDVGRLVRASTRPFAGAFTFLDGDKRVTIWRARVEEMAGDVNAVPGQLLGRSDAGVLVACGRGVINILDATVDGGGRLPSLSQHRVTGQPTVS
jgi:methionyl-tRNA formyltransferase